MPDGNHEIRRGRKYDLVLEGAREVFLRDGYGDASVDDIARVAGVSKATLYSYFPEKRLLFLEVTRTECERQAELAMQSIPQDCGIRDVLEAAARHIVAFITSDFGRRIIRTGIVESERFPEIGQLSWQTGPLFVRLALVEVFKDFVDDGALVIDDFELAADQFHELCKANIFPQVLLNIRKDFAAEEKERIALGAVETFLARYAA